MHVPATIDDALAKLADVPAPATNFKMRFIQIAQLIRLPVHGDEAAVLYAELFVIGVVSENGK